MSIHTRLQWLKIYAERLHCLGVFPKTPNHVLVNEYTPGQGIMVCVSDYSSLEADKWVVATDPDFRTHGACMTRIVFERIRSLGT
jgi:hypothetical protein